MLIEYWLVFGFLVSLFMTLLDVPLSFSRLVFLSLLGMGGAVVGGVFAYFIYGARIEGIDISFLLGTLFGAIALLLLRESISKSIRILKGGEGNAGWSI